MAMQHSVNTRTDRATAVGIFHNQREAREAIRQLKAAGFSDSEIGVASRHADEVRPGHTEVEGNMSGTGAAVGATAGLGAGALWGLGIVAGVLPAIGPVIAGGALAAIAASAAGTAVAGGVIGALVGLGIPEDEAEYYQSEFEQGRTIITVKATGERYRLAQQIMDRYNAYDYDRRDSDYASDPTASQRLNTEGKLVARGDVVEDERYL